MHTALRPYVTAGVALVGAGAIAATPIVAPPNEIYLPDIQLSASLDPISPWIDLTAEAFQNIATIGQQWLTEPLPVLSQVAINGLGYADTAVTSLSGAATGLIEWATETVPDYVQQGLQMMMDGDIQQGIGYVLLMPAAALLTGVGLPLMGLSSISADITENLHAVAAGTTQLMMFPMLGLLQTWSSTVVALGGSAQAIYDAVGAGDLTTALGAAINAPAAILDGFLNGGDYTPGLLTPLGGGIPGPLAGFLVGIPQGIAGLIGADDGTTLMSAFSGLAEAINPATFVEGLDFGAFLGDLDFSNMLGALPELLGEFGTLVPDALLNIPEMVIEALMGAI